MTNNYQNVRQLEDVLISCYQLQIKTRPRELLFSRNKKKNFQPSTPSPPPRFAASFTVFSRNYSEGGGA